MSSSSENEAPVHLMPIAAVAGMYALVTFVSLMNQAYRKVFPSSTTTVAQRKLEKESSSNSLWFQIVSFVVAVLVYANVVARVEEFTSVFDPYEILELDPSVVANDVSVVKKTYRALALKLHPDKGGDPAKFHLVNLAYKALTDDVARENYELYGHPDGPQSQMLSFALPEWLLKPTGATAAVLVLLYIGMFIGLIVYVVRFMTKPEKGNSTAGVGLNVSQSDVQYLKSNLKSNSSHIDVLCYVVTTPDSLSLSKQQLAEAEKMIAEKKASAEDDTTKSKYNQTDSILDAGGWGDEEDDAEEDARKKHEEEQKKRQNLLKEASGKNSMTQKALEGVDDGAIGWKWAEKTLAAEKLWPPTYDALQKTHADFLEVGYKRRSLTLLTGRLNSQVINNHPDLVQAAAARLLDAKYFADSMVFRQRTNLLLEHACIKIGIEWKSREFIKTTIEAMTMFKIGCPSVDSKITEWFAGVLRKTYGGDHGLPRVSLTNKKIETADEDEIATDDLCTLSFGLERGYAPHVLKHKIETCQKQGVNPQLALQLYRESWWVIISCKQKGVKDDFEFVSAQPLLITNPAVELVEPKIKFKAPSEPGQYVFLIEIKSTEYLGSDESFEIDVDIIDKENLPDVQEEDEDENLENKKDK